MCLISAHMVKLFGSSISALVLLTYLFHFPTKCLEITVFYNKFFSSNQRCGHLLIYGYEWESGTKADDLHLRGDCFWNAIHHFLFLKTVQAGNLHSVQYFFFVQKTGDLHADFTCYYLVVLICLFLSINNFVTNT